MAETALNTVWVLLCLGAFAGCAWSEVRLRSHSTGTARSKRLLAVLFAALFLFPCVSASDDLMSLRDLQFTSESRGELETPPSRHGSGDRPGAQVSRFFESLQNLRIAAVCALVLNLALCALVFFPAATSPVRSTASFSGRAPPRLASF